MLMTGRHLLAVLAAAMVMNYRALTQTSTPLSISIG
jgi:hypothetical protein